MRKKIHVFSSSAGRPRRRHDRHRGTFLWIAGALVILLLLTAALLLAAGGGDAGAEQQEYAEEPLEKEQENPEKEQENPEKEQENPEKEQESGENQESADKKRTLAVFGDSISTFVGTMPDGYYDFFPGEGQVTNLEDIWWKRVSDSLDLRLLVNASSSGATCAGDSTSKDNPQVGCDDFRTGGLRGADGERPDIILVYLGTNDLLESVPMGTNDGTAAVAEGEISSFSDAYTLMLDKLRAGYPEAEIYCCTITQIGTWGSDGTMIPFVNGADGGRTAADYGEKIRQIAGNKGAAVIDLYHCGITMENIMEMTSDGVHPNPAGMQCIAQTVLDTVQ